MRENGQLKARVQVTHSPASDMGFVSLVCVWTPVYLFTCVEGTGLVGCCFECLLGTEPCAEPSVSFCWLPPHQALIQWPILPSLLLGEKLRQDWITCLWLQFHNEFKPDKLESVFQTLPTRNVQCLFLLPPACSQKKKKRWTDLKLFLKYKKSWSMK